MLGGYENIVALPTMGVFDTSMMQADIAAAREMYNLARDDYKDFLKTYGDFFSISDVDNANYYKMTLGAANDLIQKYGPSLTRSAEGRAAIWNMINGIDKKAIANMRASAETMQLFIKARDALAAQGRYDERWDKYYSNMVDPTSWDSTKGVWTRTAPSAVQTLHDLTREEFEKLEPSENIGTFKGDDGVTYSVMGVSDATKAQSFEAAKRRVEATPGAQMYKDNIRASLMNDPNFKNKSAAEITAEVNKRFDDLILQEQSMYTQPRHVVNPKWNMDYSAALSRRSGGGRYGGGSDAYLDDGYLAVQDQGLGTLYGMTLQYGANDYDQVFATIYSTNKGLYQKVAEDITTDFYGGIYSSLMHRNSVDGDGNRVYAQASDANKLVTSQEMITGNLTSAGNRIRTSFPKNVTKTDFAGTKYNMVLNSTGGQQLIPNGDGTYSQYISVVLEVPEEHKIYKTNNGKKELTSNTVSYKSMKTPMYMKTGYVYKKVGNKYVIDRANSASGIVGDIRVGHKDLGLSHSQKVQNVGNQNTGRK